MLSGFSGDFDRNGRNPALLLLRICSMFGVMRQKPEADCEKSFSSRTGFNGSERSFVLRFTVSQV
jgi:hypothetical protein